MNPAISSFFTADPALRLLQAGIIAGAFFLLFLLFWTLRDILLRTRSFAYQFVCVLVVALLPVVGFLLYLLIRPARTLKQRETDAMLRQILGVEEIETVDAQEDILVLPTEMPESRDDDADKKPFDDSLPSPL